MTQWNYRYAGLQIASDVSIPEWSIFEQAEPFSEVDVRIILHDAQPGPVAHPSDGLITPDEYCFSMPETGAYRIVRGREIGITPLPNAGEHQLRLFLLGSAWGVLCYQRGLLALHTSVVQVGTRAVAFCGASGAGKSSIAAELVARGYPLIGDDLCCFDFRAGRLCVYPGAPRLKLWRNTLDHLGWQDDNWVRDHFRLDKYQTTVSSGEAVFQAAEPALPLPVHAVYLLTWGDLGLTRVTGLNALRRLIASATYRAGLLEPLGQIGPYWELCAQLVRTTPIWELARPRDWAAVEATLELLVKNL